MDRCVPPPLIKKPTIPIQLLKKVRIRLSPPEVQTAHFEVAPVVAVVIVLAAVVAEEGHCVIRVHVFGVVLHEALDAVPERGDCLDVFVEGEDEAVDFVVVAHEAEDVVVDVAVELDGGLDAPVVFVVEEERVSEEEAGFEAAHVAVGDGVTVDDFALGLGGS